MECCRYGVPDAGEQVHDEEYAKRTGKMAQELPDHRTFAAERDIALQREVDALTDDDGCEVGEGEREPAVREAVADHGQGQRDAHYLCLDGRP